MGIDGIRTVAVIGTGEMGTQIAMLCALAGFKTYLHDLADAILDQPLEKLKFQMQRMVEKKTITSTENKMAFARLHVTDLEDAVSGADLIIEAVEDKDADKPELLANLNKIAPPKSIIATSSSASYSPLISSPIRAPRLVNINFYHPPFKMHLVEIITFEHTTVETAQTMVDFVVRLNKKPVLLRKEVSGLLADRLKGALMREALALLEERLATHEEIDFAATEVLGHPMGPFELLDMSGIDTHYYLQLEQYEKSGNAAFLPSRILREKLHNGELGRKTGRGFYSY